MTKASGINKDRYQVLIAGAGPVGLLLANFLGQKGFSCLLIDKRTASPQWSRAIGVAPPSLAILQQVDLDQQFVQRGVKIQHAWIHDDYGCAGGVDFDSINGEFRYILTIPQADNMDILEKGFETCDNVVFERGYTLSRIDCDRDGVHAELYREEAGDRIQVSAEWLIGCDGAKSTTRELAGLPFQHKVYPQRFVMADYHETTDWLDVAKLFFTKEGSLESFPIPGKKRRWITLLPQKTELADPDHLEQQTMRLSNQDLKGARCSRLFEFTPERIKVNSLSKDRIILAGDAAHVMTPIGGQGMNTGFGDVEYLAEILPRLINEKANPYPLLEAYTRCRKKAAAYSRRRTAAGMWFGTRTGKPASVTRSLFLRGLLLKYPIGQRLTETFAMQTVPHNRFYS